MRKGGGRLRLATGGSLATEGKVQRKRASSLRVCTLTASRELMSRPEGGMTKPLPFRWGGEIRWESKGGNGKNEFKSYLRHEGENGPKRQSVASSRAELVGWVRHKRRLRPFDLSVRGLREAARNGKEKRQMIGAVKYFTSESQSEGNRRVLTMSGAIDQFVRRKGETRAPGGIRKELVQGKKRKNENPEVKKFFPRTLEDKLSRKTSSRT